MGYMYVHHSNKLASFNATLCFASLRESPRGERSDQLDCLLTPCFASSPEMAGVLAFEVSWRTSLLLPPGRSADFWFDGQGRHNTLYRKRMASGRHSEPW